MTGGDGEEKDALRGITNDCNFNYSKQLSCTPNYLQRRIFQPTQTDS
jgi:hypothetical protein